MVPNEILEYSGIVQLLLHFSWTWIGLISWEYILRVRFLEIIPPLLYRQGICTDFILKIPTRTYANEMSALFSNKLEKISILTKSKANVFVISFGTLPMYTFYTYLHPNLLDSSLGKVWIVTTYWAFKRTTSQMDWDIQLFQGALSLSVHTKEPPGFRTFLHSVNSLWAKEDPFFHDFWEKVFKCSLKNLNGKDKLWPVCTGQQNLESLPETFFEMSITGHSYAVYNAVHAVAYALHDLFQSRSQKRLQGIGKKLFPQNIQPWEVIIRFQI